MVLGERNPVKVTDQKAREPSAPPPSVPSRPRYVFKSSSAPLYLHPNFGKEGGYKNYTDTSFTR
jgi:hypothetical protein